MPKKSNKTEHVLSLITKGEDQPDAEHGDGAAVKESEPEVEILINEKQEKELKVERKLTVEIEPDVLIKPSEKEEELIAKGLGIPVENTEEKRAYLINLTEKLVTEMADDVMAKTNVCTCPVCKNDVLALALNSLTQHYVTSDAGKQYIQLDIYKKQHETDVLAALIKACVRVKASPKHPEK